MNDNKRLFIDNLVIQFGYNSLSDCLFIQFEDFNHYGGSKLLSEQSSIIEFISDLYYFNNQRQLFQNNQMNRCF